MHVDTFTLLMFGALGLCAASDAGAIPDCSKPKTKVEWLLCSNDRLAVAEQRMALAFREALNRTSDRAALLKEQKEWNQHLPDACNDVPCLMQAYRERTEELDTY